MKSSSDSRPTQGFTLVEMLAVCALMAVCALAVLPLSEITSVRWKERELRSALLAIRAAIDEYKRFQDEIGPKGVYAGSGYPPDLWVLVEGVPDPRPHARTARKVWLRRLPRDPFAPEHLPADQTWGLRSFESPAHLPQPGADVYDVHSLSTRMGTNGIWLRQW